MNNCPHWKLWRVVGAAVIAAVILVVILWVARPSRFPDDAVLVPRDVASLQQALDLASPGTTIVIQDTAGPIEGPIMITASDITLIASGGRVRLTSVGSQPALTIRGDGVTVRGFEITSESIGLQIDASDCTIENLVIESTPIGIQLTHASRCVLESIDIRRGQIGLELINSSSLSVHHLTVDGSSEYGVRLLGSWNNWLSNLDLSNNAVGISIEQGSTDNVIKASDIKFSSIAGIEIRNSDNNVLVGNRLDSNRIGIMLDRVTGTEIRDCEVRRSLVSGVFLQQAGQNRIVETHIHKSKGTGIQLTQSGENALLNNLISDCQQAGIALVSSNRNLIMGNELDGCLIGIQVEQSNYTRILRNHVVGSRLSGLFVSLGSSNSLLDNVVIGGSYGIILSQSSDNTLLRNILSRADGAGLFLVRTRGENHVADNSVRASAAGLMLLASTRDRVIHNRFTDNEIGILSAQMGGGTRIEGNMISGNQVGFKQQTSLDGLESDLAMLGIMLPPDMRTALPILTNNMFKDNAAHDIRNECLISLPAAGNWWGAAVTRDTAHAIVSSGVSFEQSAWKGTIAIGTGSDDVRVLLGRILQMSLIEAGFRVIDLVGMGDQERVQQALLDADVDLIWWSGETFADQPSIERSSTIVLPTYAHHGWRIIVSAELAGQLPELTVSGLANWFNETGQQLRYTATIALGEDSLTDLLAAYELSESVYSFTSAAALDEVEALLKFGAMDVAIVESLEETLTLSGFLAIEDALRVLRQDPISMVIQQSIANRYPEVNDVLTTLGERLTSEVLHNLVSRIRLLHKKPADVAREFLQQ